MHILIIGDSWGKGVWSARPDRKGKIIHPGIDLFLSSAGVKVTNKSGSGLTNVYLYGLLKETDLKPYDYILMYHTNPIRDIFHKANLYYRFFSNAEDRSVTIKDLEEVYRVLVREFYNNINSLGPNIHLLGGHNKIDPIIKEYSNLINVIPSLREHFYPNFTERLINYASPPTSEFPLFQTFLPKLTLDALDYIIDNRNYWDNLAISQKDFFYPDGYHLNIRGHGKLAEYLITNVFQNK